MSIPIHLPHQQPSPIAESTPLTTLNSSTTSTPVLPLQTLPAACPICSTYFRNPSFTTRSSRPLLTNTNKSSHTVPTPWIIPEILSLKSARRRLERTYNASHSFFDLKLLRSSINRYHKFIAAAKKSFYATLVQSFSSKLRALWKTIITSYTELQIAPYPHHPLLLPYHSYLPHTSVIKSQSFISTYKPTPLPPQLILSHLLPFLYSMISHLPSYLKSTIYSLNHLIHTVISILFIPPY